MVENRDRARRACKKYRVNKLCDNNNTMKAEWQHMETEANKDVQQIEEQMRAHEVQFKLKQVS